MFIREILLLLSTARTSKKKTYYEKYCNGLLENSIAEEDLNPLAFKYHRNYLIHNLLKSKSTEEKSAFKYSSLCKIGNKRWPENPQHLVFRSQEITNISKRNYHKSIENFVYGKYYIDELKEKELLFETDLFLLISCAPQELRSGKEIDIFRENLQIFNIILYTCERKECRMILRLLMQLYRFYRPCPSNIKLVLSDEYLLFTIRYMHIYINKDSTQNKLLKLDNDDIPYGIDDVLEILNIFANGLLLNFCDENHSFERFKYTQTKEGIGNYIKETNNRCVAFFLMFYLEAQKGNFYSSCFVLYEIYTFLKGLAIDDIIKEYLRNGIVIQFKKMYKTSQSNCWDIEVAYNIFLSNCSFFIKRYQDFYNELLALVFEVHPVNIKFEEYMEPFLKFCITNRVNFHLIRYLDDFTNFGLLQEYLQNFYFERVE